VYGDIHYTVFNKDSGPIAAPGSADIVITARNIHNWIWETGEVDKAMKDFYAVLKPGGILAVEEHRADPKPDTDGSKSGYVATQHVIDLAAKAGHGVLHKYDGRALLIASGSCAVNCRYCFRRHFPYSEEIAAASHWQEALAQVRADPSIRELILSGGDPLALATHKLEELTRGLAELPQVIRLRIHTRLPVVLPERIDDTFVAWLEALPLQKVVVLHANHANELDAAVDAACARLRDAGATLLNQSVLLRGINDEVGTLAALSERLFAAGVLPYYLHQLDRVQGAAHFEVDDGTALDLQEALRARLPGYLVPRLVREVAGDPAKRPL